MPEQSKRTDQTCATVTDILITDGGYEVEVELGGGMKITAEHTSGPNTEDPPVVGDEAYMVRGEGKGTWVITGYGRQGTPTALPGEFKVIARDESGATVAQFHMRHDGSIVLNNVVIDRDGNISTPGNLDADGSVAALAKGAKVVLDDHAHPHSMAPTLKAFSPAGA